MKRVKINYKHKEFNWLVRHITDEEAKWLFANSKIVTEIVNGEITYFAEFENDALASEYCLRFNPWDTISK